MSAPSYHDLYITTPDIPRTRLFDLPFDYLVTCRRTTGWELRTLGSDSLAWDLLAGEYDGPEKWLILDVNGHVIVNSRDREAAE